MSAVHDVAIIGAGPYGLSSAAHLRARGLDVHVLGRPMELWERHMPIGMFLRSSWDASTISDPAGALTLDAYEERLGAHVERPIPLADYLRYARWFQREAVPDVDERRVVELRRVPDGFELELDDGDDVAARRVVMATGPAEFARWPAQFAGLPTTLARHSSELRDLDEFAGRRTVVVGAGQSAVEVAALLGESGAEVEIVARANRIRWLRRSGWLHAREGVVRRALYPPTDVGPVGLSHLVAKPNAFRCVPVRLGHRIAYRCIRPAASGWLVDRTRPIAVTLGRSVVSTTANGEVLRLRLDDGTTRQVDRLVLATGFDLRADRHPLLGPHLLTALRTREGAPLLGPGLESSVPGLHFVGALAAESFGPIMRFVSGTPFTGRELADHIARAWQTAPVQRRPASVPV